MIVNIQKEPTTIQVETKFLKVTCDENALVCKKC